jgi:oxaloacetate decarboxylase gamma subunit
MSISNLLMEGVNLMLLGMGIVFVFLTLLVVAMGLMSRIAARLGGAEEVAEASATGAAATTSGADNGELIAVMSAAISRFRSRNR